MLLFGEDEINHPAATYVGAGVAQMAENRLLVAAGLFQGVGEDSKANEVEVPAGRRTLLVNGFGL